MDMNGIEKVKGHYNPCGPEHTKKTEMKGEFLPNVP
jgi:hypothetical protein